MSFVKFFYQRWINPCLVSRQTHFNKSVRFGRRSSTTSRRTPHLSSVWLGTWGSILRLGRFGSISICIYIKLLKSLYNWPAIAITYHMKHRHMHSFQQRKGQRHKDRLRKGQQHMDQQRMGLQNRIWKVKSNGFKK